MAHSSMCAQQDAAAGAGSLTWTTHHLFISLFFYFIFGKLLAHSTHRPFVRHSDLCMHNNLDDLKTRRSNDVLCEQSIRWSSNASNNIRIDLFRMIIAVVVVALEIL